MTTVDISTSLYTEVQQFYSRQMQRLDGQDIEGYAATFTEDAIFDHTTALPASVTRTGIINDLYDFREMGKNDPVQKRHYFSMIDLEYIDIDEIRSTVYCLVIKTRPGKPAEANPSCVVHDVLVRVDGELQTKSRHVRYDSDSPLLQGKTVAEPEPTAQESLALPAAAQDLLFREARTANTFTDEPVSDEQMRVIYELIKFGPTSMNQQPLRIVLVRSGEARSRLVKHLLGANQAKTLAAPLVAILAADLNFHDELPTQFPHLPEAKDYFADADARAASARSNALIQVGYIILGIRAAGLAAGPMTGFDADAVDQEFFPDGIHQSLVVVNIGKPGPDAWHPRLPRLAYDDVVTSV
ncbi:putative malonic semialdehyde reductase RutE [Mycobacteroides salmoniphilum]|uniref:Putative malonic semialdehyde reductase RutE n=1 Tax=Mycobacteroides salmoniphilum TaxID=404941 RepID=A0A4R8S4A2_9MYCO|nr:putative malonic semialdehyde reductase RutE [Mycobacteroides salmoniphilum]